MEQKILNIKNEAKKVNIAILPTKCQAKCCKGSDNEPKTSLKIVIGFNFF